MAENYDDLGDMGENFAEDLERFAEDTFIQAALGQGVDLRGYSRQIEQDLREVEVESVRDYVAQSEQLVDLHNQMQSCDAILKRMQEMLLGFQADLVGISDEIKHLQEESLSMNVKLRNRRAVESGLKGFLGFLSTSIVFLFPKRTRYRYDRKMLWSLQPWCHTFAAGKSVIF